MNDTTYGESLFFLIGEFMNLVNACEYKKVEFVPTDGATLQDYKSTINDYLGKLGFDDKDIEEIWSGEIQLTSS